MYAKIHPIKHTIRCISFWKYCSDSTQGRVHFIWKCICAFYSRCRKKAKKRMLNLHANICCCRNTATCFLLCDIKGTQKSLQRHCYRLFLNVFSKTQMSMGLNLQHVHLESSTTFLTPPPHHHHPILKYINSLFL